MRARQLLLVGALVAGCSSVPELDSTPPPVDPAAPYPNLMPEPELSALTAAPGAKNPADEIAAAGAALKRQAAAQQQASAD